MPKSVGIFHFHDTIYRVPRFTGPEPFPCPPEGPVNRGVAVLHRQLCLYFMTNKINEALPGGGRREEGGRRRREEGGGRREEGGGRREEGRRYFPPVLIPSSIQ